MTANEVGKRIRAMRERNKRRERQRRADADVGAELDRIEPTVRAAVDLLFCECFRFFEPERLYGEEVNNLEDYEQEARAFLVTDEGKAVLDTAIALDAPGYAINAVYYHLLYFVSREYSFGRFRHRRKIRLLGGSTAPDSPDPSAASSLNACEFRMFLEDVRRVSPDMHRYLTGVVDGLSDCRMQEEWGWPRAFFETVRDQTRAWLACQFPDQVAWIDGWTEILRVRQEAEDDQAGASDR